MSTINNGIPFVPENTIDPAAGLNLSLVTIDALLQVLVQSVGVNTPTTGVDGQRFIVGTAPTGAWAGQANKLARFLNGAWQFYSARYALNATDGLWYVRPAATWAPLAGGGGGEANTASNLGVGEGVFASKSGVDLQFKSLVAGTNVTLSADGNTITINASGGGGSGDVVGPASAIDGEVALFDTTTGKLLRGGGVLGDAAFTDAADYATSAQGSLADSAVQPADLAGYERVLTAGANITIDRTDPLNPVISASASSGMTNPMTAAGDIIKGGTAGAPERVAIGSTGQLLSVVSGSPAWVDPPSGAGDVVGPAGATDGGVALFDGATGKLLKSGAVLGTAAFDDTGDFATAAQGMLADSAVQPGDLATVATTGAYSDLSGLPTLGTAASTAATDYATAAQGLLAASALQPSAIGVTVQGYDADTAKLDVAQTWTAMQTLGTAIRETAVNVSASNIDLSLGSIYYKTISAATTFTVSNVPASGITASLLLDLTNGGAAAVTWWANVKWPAGTPPTLTASGRDVIGFYTRDNGTTWTGLLLGKDVK